MCGIIGTISTRPVFHDVARGLLALQNRGKESTGIIGYDPEHHRFTQLLREPAPASEVYKEAFFALPNTSRVAIGHNRYATSGDDVMRDIQPLRITHPGIAGAHNGQVANLITLESRLRQEEWNLDTTCDVELLIAALGQSLLNHRATANDTATYLERRLWPALQKLMDDHSPLFINGAYSLVAIIDGHGLLGLRDPFGIRPMVFGERREADGNVTYSFASEPSAFYRMGGFSNIRTVEPGEAVFIDFAMGVAAHSIAKKGQRFCGFEHTYFAGVNSKLEGITVYDARLAFGRKLAEEYVAMKEELDVLMPIPDSPIPVAQGMSEVLGVPWREGIVKNAHYAKRVFQERDDARRRDGLDQKYFFIKTQLEGKRVGVVDDSIVRGDTTQFVVRELRRLGATAVHLFISFPAISHPCPYGIDTPDPEELVARRVGAPFVATAIGADSVNYISHAGFAQALGIPSTNLCMACTNGEYPTGAGVTEYTQMRREQRPRQR